MKIIKLFLKIFKWFFIGVLAAAVLLNMINIFRSLILKEQMPLMFGYGNAVIITGSMEPEIMPGDIVIVHRQSDYEVNDVVTYRGNNTPITHRVIEKTPDGFITQGDANNTDDGLIEQNRIIGKVVRIIPKVGNAIMFFQSAPGMLILLVGLFAIIKVPGWIRKIHENYKAGSKGKYFRR